MGKKVIFIFCLILTAKNVFASGKSQITASNQIAAGNQVAADSQTNSETGSNDDYGLSSAAGMAATQELHSPAEVPRARAEQVMKALAAAYPDRIKKVEFRNNDWALLLRDTWYYYMEGKILPETKLDNAANYSRQPFYNYPADLPPWKKPSDEETERYRTIASNRSSGRIQRASYFFDDLYRARTREESYQRVKSIRFLGKPVTVHYSILEELSLVEERIQELEKTNSQVRAWVSSLNKVDGWMWRNIADVQSRSFHAYGAAVDIQPKSLGSKQTYWLWTARSNLEWWNVSHNQRYHPPDAVIKAFEAYGFIWGGKWLLFDTMHFEYRPEILILNGLELDTLR